MTERLYYTDAYLARFDAAVLERGDGGRRIYLDRTAFYPTSGGQPFDAGRLGESSIVNVIDEGERIAHLLDAPLDPAAARVEGVVEWARRFDHMQQHTGQHLLSAVLAELFGWATESVHFGAETSTLDLDAGAVSPEQMRAAETRANEIVWEDRPVTVSFEDAESAGGLRKASDRSGTLRIVSIGELDRSACGGTHVRATGAIGAILIRGSERVRKQARVEFVCGGRALRDAWRNRALVQSLAAAYSAAPADLPALVEAQRAELKGAEAARRALEQELDAHRARALHAATPADAAGLRRALVRDVEGGIERLRGLAQAYAAEPRSVLVGALAAPPALLVATSADSGIDAGARLQAVLGQVGGRGGGNARLAQGTVPDAAALARAVELLA